MLCDHLEGWDRDGGREGDARGKRYGDICICITDSLCYKAETNTPLESNYTPIKMLKQKKKRCIDCLTGSPRRWILNMGDGNIAIQDSISVSLMHLQTLKDLPHPTLLSFILKGSLIELQLKKTTCHIIQP